MRNLFTIVSQSRSEDDLLRSLTAIIEASLLVATFGSYENGFLQKLESEPLLDPLERGHSRQLRALWGFADTYFDGFAHGESNVDGIPLAEAEQFLRQAIALISVGKEIDSPQVLRYADLYK